LIRSCYQLSIRMLIDKSFSRVLVMRLDLSIVDNK
jgi:hypothetical protein